MTEPITTPTWLEGLSPISGTRNSRLKVPCRDSATAINNHTKNAFFQFISLSSKIYCKYIFADKLLQHLTLQ